MNLHFVDAIYGGVTRAGQGFFGQAGRRLHAWLMDGLRKLHRAQPGMALALTVDTSPLLIDPLARGTLDLAIAAPVDRHGADRRRAGRCGGVFRAGADPVAAQPDVNP